jgi:hypothetical protein
MGAVLGVIGLGLGFEAHVCMSLLLTRCVAFCLVVLHPAAPDSLCCDPRAFDRYLHPSCAWR